MIKVLIALFSAIASIATTVSATFLWRDNYLRFANTLELLKSERFKFETRTTKGYSLDLTLRDALENFVSNIESLAVSELSGWIDLFKKQKG